MAKVKINYNVLNKIDIQAQSALDISSEYLKTQMQETARGSFGDYLKALDTGNFLRSFFVRKVRAFFNKVVNDAEYAPELEFGTTKMRARPNMRVNAIKSKNAIIAIFKKAINV